jgi:hypothetical protein
MRLSFLEGMRLWALLTLPLLLRAQTPPEPTPVPAGATRRIVLQLATAPIAGDAIYFTVSTKQLAIVVITPDGVRFTEETAEKAGFDWGQLDATPPIGSSDAGALGSTHFLRDGLAGTYVVEFTAPAGVHNASATAQFGSEQEKYLAGMSHIAGFQKIGPFRLIPGRTPLEIVVDRDEEGALLDLVTPGNSPLLLTLPNGQTIDSKTGKRAKVTWVSATRETIDPPDAMVGIGGFLLPGKGMHQVLTFEKAAKGKYKIRAAGGPTVITAAFIPFGRMMTEEMDSSSTAPRPPAGQIAIQPYGLPNAAKVGDKLPVMFGIEGEPLSDLRFVVQMEYRQIVSRQPLRFSTPEVIAVPTTFTKNAEGLYTATIVPDKAGALRVGVEVSGRSSNGRSVSERSVLSELTVTRVVARFLGLTMRKVDVDHDGLFDRLEISANLDVAVPGDYEMRLELTGSTHSPVFTHVEGKLGAGAQAMTVAVPAEVVRSRLLDGTWTIGVPLIFRPEGNTFGESVVVPQTPVKMEGNRIDEWRQ